MQSFCHENPEVTFSLLLRDTKQVLQSIKDYTFDLGFTGECGPREGLEKIKVAENELILAAAPTIKIRGSGQASAILPEVALQNCTALPFLLREPGSATRMVFEGALKKRAGPSINLNIAGYLESQEAIKEACKTGLGVTVISHKAVEDELKAGLLKGYRIKDMLLKRIFYLVFRKKSVFSPLSKAFFKFTLHYFNLAEDLSPDPNQR